MQILLIGAEKNEKNLYNKRWGCEKSPPRILESIVFLRYSVAFMQGTADFFTAPEQIKHDGMLERNIMSKDPVTHAKGLSAVIPKDNDGYCTVYKMDCADGLGLMTVYQVYPGIQLIYNDFEATSCDWNESQDKNILEINHCREGREGSTLLSGSCLYLGEGDLSIHTMDNCFPEMSFPLKHYRGISE